ncbi:MAG: hypothetical protein O3A51_01080 [Verrucomicrobia bacterium]|nr:hypothetical protein [Verrucomicrobiota bacterium]
MATDGGRLVGRAQTVLGPVPLEAMCVTLPHEHLFVDFSCMFDPPVEATECKRAYQPFTLENLGWIRTYYFRHYPNLFLDDEQVTLTELEVFRRAGGNTIIEVTPMGLGRDPLARVTRASSPHVIVATGYYIISHASAGKGRAHGGRPGAAHDR